MKYYISFQQLLKGSDRPIDHPSASDHETEASNAALIPNVGDFVIIEPMGDKDAPRYQGRVHSRLFTYFGKVSCSVNIVVEDYDDAEAWGKVIKE